MLQKTAQRSKRKRYVMGNWKMNPQFPEQAKNIVSAVKKAVKNITRTEVVLLPPSVFLHECMSKSSTSSVPYGVGVQNVFYEESGSHTGELSANMIKNLGATHILVGHSERRAMGETDEMVAKKVAAVMKVGLTAIVCVGEKIRDSQGEYLEPLREQIKQSLSLVTKKDLKNLVVAYEPVWAIGAQEAMSPGLIHEMMIFVKKVLSDMFGQEEVTKVPILYGGSVNFRNAGEIILLGEADGLLVGRESVNPTGFVELLKVVDEVQ